MSKPVGVQRSTFSAQRRIVFSSWSESENENAHYGGLIVKFSALVNGCVYLAITLPVLQSATIPQNHLTDLRKCLYSCFYE